MFRVAILLVVAAGGVSVVGLGSKVENKSVSGGSGESGGGTPSPSSSNPSGNGQAGTPPSQPNGRGGEGTQNQGPKPGTGGTSS